MKKNIFYALMMPALLLGAVSCTDYQDDIDKARCCHHYL